MKRLTIFAATLAASFCTVDLGSKPLETGQISFMAQAQARRQGGVSFSVFYQSLRPYGHWAQYRPYGYVFIPDVGRGWRPYSDGRWVHSARYGWVWDSYEPFGWATFHYGWWDFDPRYGWFWVPGYEWAPSWVVWRQSDDVIGWAPMPARYVWGRPYIEISIGWRDHYWNDPNPWCFTRARYIGDRHAARHIAPVQQNITYINQTTTVYNTTVINNTIVNEGPDVAALEQASGAQVARAEINAVAEPPPVASADAQSAQGGDGVVVNAFIPEAEPAISGSQIIAAPEADAVPAALASEAPVLEPSIPGPSSPEANAAPEAAPAAGSLAEPAAQADPAIAVGEPDPSAPAPMPDAPYEAPAPLPEPAPGDTVVNAPPAPEAVPEPTGAIPEPMPPEPLSEPIAEPPPEPSYPQPEMAAPEPAYPAPEPVREPEPQYAPPPEPEYAPPPEPEYSAPEPMPEAMPAPMPDAMPEPMPTPEPMPMPEPMPAPMPEPAPAPAPDGVPPPG